MFPGAHLISGTKVASAVPSRCWKATWNPLKGRGLSSSSPKESPKLFFWCSLERLHVNFSAQHRVQDKWFRCPCPPPSLFSLPLEEPLSSAEDVLSSVQLNLSSLARNSATSSFTENPEVMFLMSYNVLMSLGSPGNCMLGADLICR